MESKNASFCLVFRITLAFGLEIKDQKPYINISDAKARRNDITTNDYQFVVLVGFYNLKSSAEFMK